MTPPKDPERYKEWIEGNRIRTTNMMKDPKRREHLRNLRLGTKHTPEEIEKIRKSGTGIKRWPNGRPEMKGAGNPSCREDVKLKKQLKRKGVPLNLTREQRDRIIEMNKSRKGKMSIETKLKMSLSHQGDKCHLWKGGISFQKYCPKFSRELKERVRAFFDYQCFECGTPQNGKKLSVHHVNYDKMVCCNDIKPLFVPLCNKCHAITSHKNRQFWENYFTDVINSYYEGKCYLTRKEFICLNP